MNRKKIGLVVSIRKNHNNYGTSLVAYALLKKLQLMGYSPEIVHYVKQLSIADKIEWSVNAIRCGFMNRIIDIIREGNKKSLPKEYVENVAVRTKAVNTYKEQKLQPFYHDYVGYKALCEGSKNYDVVMVGSDQVWNPRGLPTRFTNLLFVDDAVRKVSYSSSFGVQNVPEFQKRATAAYLNRFDSIAVREIRAKEIVEELSHKSATVVADPTLLLSREEWEKEIENTPLVTTGKYIFCYLISENEDARRQATALAKEKGLKIVCIRHLEKYRPVDDTYGDEAPYNVGPNEFVKLIQNAEYVCTDSFHCTVFSSIFHKQTLTFYRSSLTSNATSSRIDSLYEVLGLNKSHIFSGDIHAINTPVDWERVEQKLANLRAESERYIYKALS